VLREIGVFTNFVPSTRLPSLEIEIDLEKAIASVPALMMMGDVAPADVPGLK
jgi:hypothetical protein